MKATTSSLKETLQHWHAADRPLPKKKKGPPEKVVTRKEAYSRNKAVFAANVFTCLFLAQGCTRLGAVTLWRLYQVAKFERWKELVPLRDNKKYNRLWTAIRSRKKTTITGNAYWAHRFLRYANARKILTMEKIEEELIQKWIREAAECGTRTSTCENMRAGVSFLFRLSKPVFEDSKWTQDTMRLIRREFALPPTQRPPIGQQFIRAAGILLKNGRVPNRIQYVLALTSMTLGFLMNCRGEHLTKATWDKLFISNFRGFALIRLRHADTKTSDGSELDHSSCFDSEDALGFSIVKLLQCIAKQQSRNSKWIFAWRKNGKTQRFDSAKQSYYYNRFAQILGLNFIRKLGSHSPRLGSATAASILNVSSEKRRIFGKWAKDSSMQIRYNLARATVGAEMSILLMCANAATRRKMESTLTVVRKKIADGEGMCEPWLDFDSAQALFRLAAAPSVSQSSVRLSAALRRV